jgi:GntR family transcriptional regulator
VPDPRWRQIAEDLRLKIDSGEFGGDGRPMPSELELQDRYKVSRNTVRDAVKWLVTRGLVVTRPGQGTFVVKKTDPFVTTLSTDAEAGPSAESAGYLSEVTAGNRVPTVSLPRVEIQQASAQVAAELRLAEGATVVSRHQQRFIDGTPWSLQTSFYPMRLVEQGAVALIRAEDIQEGAVSYIQKEFGVKQVGWRDRLVVRAPDPNEAAFFALPDDGRIAVFELIRTSYDESGEPLRVTITTYPADRNQFVLTVGKVPDER